MEFAEDFRLRSIVRKYSDHIGVPVRMVKAEMPAVDDEDKDAEKDAAEPGGGVNSAKALWTFAL